MANRIKLRFSKRDRAMYRLLKNLLAKYESSVNLGILPLTIEDITDFMEVSFTPLESLALYEDLRRRISRMRDEGKAAQQYYERAIK